jgi:hypothetical protein
LWAKHNIQDADGNELYFAWGGTQGYTAEQVGNEEGKRAFSFIWEDYEFGNPPSKYNGTDGKAILDTSDDAAYVNWGSEWRMPTKKQFDELTANTTSAWTQVDGVNGLLCTSTANGNTLFFPAVGYAEDGKVSNVGDIGDYWSVSLYDDGVYDAWELDFSGRKCEVGNNYRCYGHSVRPVRL